jgi:Ca2+-binding EF-hand superfamily protein
LTLASQWQSRGELRISQGRGPTQELLKLFKAVDVDGGGTVDAQEFLRWLFPSEANNPKARSPKGKKEGARSVAQVKRRFKVASAGMCEEIGW